MDKGKKKPRTLQEQEDAQEFLSFIMDLMHDELFKLEGQPSSINGLKSSLVSSAEEDEWETVGPKNTSARKDELFLEKGG
ncbi:unnamed protein product [Prunus armeniaca]|nr:unnamed protein product [Prunus armeniaca]